LGLPQQEEEQGEGFDVEGCGAAEEEDGVLEGEVEGGGA